MDAYKDCKIRHFRKDYTTYGEEVGFLEEVYLSCAEIIKPRIKKILSDEKSHTRSEIFSAVSEEIKSDVSDSDIQNTFYHMVQKGECIRVGRGVYVLASTKCANDADGRVIVDLYKKFYEDCMIYINQIDLWKQDKNKIYSLLETKELCESSLKRLNELWR